MQVSETVIEGINDPDISALLVTDRIGARVVVVNEEAEQLFMLPGGDWTADQINAVLRVYKQAVNLGEEYGAKQAQATMRAALGL